MLPKLKAKLTTLQATGEHGNHGGAQKQKVELKTGNGGPKGDHKGEYGGARGTTEASFQSQVLADTAESKSLPTPPGPPKLCLFGK